jgi:hypothetical protein
MKNILLLLLLFVTSSAVFSQMTKSELEGFFRQHPPKPLDEIVVSQGGESVGAVKVNETFQSEFRDSGYYCTSMNKVQEVILVQYSSIASVFVYEGYQSIPCATK